MLLDDQGATQWNHHEDSEHAAKCRDQKHPRQFQIETKNKNRGHGHAETKGQRFTSRACSLHDIVFEDRRVLESHLRPKPE